MKVFLHHSTTRISLDQIWMEANHIFIHIYIYMYIRVWPVKPLHKVIEVTCVSRGSLSPAQWFLKEGPCYWAVSAARCRSLSGRDLWPRDCSGTKQKEKKQERKYLKTLHYYMLHITYCLGQHHIISHYYARANIYWGETNTVLLTYVFLSFHS